MTRLEADDETEEPLLRGGSRSARHETRGASGRGSTGSRQRLPGPTPPPAPIRFIPLDTDAAPGRTATDPFRSVHDRDEVLGAMAALDADQRLVVVLHYWADLTLQDVADRVGWPIGTVKSRLHHALERMRRRWARGSRSRGRSADDRRSRAPAARRVRRARLPLAPPSLARLLAELAIEPAANPSAAPRRGWPLFAAATSRSSSWRLAGRDVPAATAPTNSGPGPPPSTSATPSSTPNSSRRRARRHRLTARTDSGLRGRRTQTALAGPDRPSADRAARLLDRSNRVHSCAYQYHSDTNLEGYCHDGEYGITQLNEPILRTVNAPAGAAQWSVSPTGIPEALASRCSNCRS